MPTYQYACRDCGEQLEVVQAFSDDPLTECPHCGGSLRKVFSAVGIAFKGSGFYKTDSRGSSSSTTSTSTGSSGEGSASSGGDSSPSTSSSGESSGSKDTSSDSKGTKSTSTATTTPA